MLNSIRLRNLNSQIDWFWIYKTYSGSDFRFALEQPDSVDGIQSMAILVFSLPAADLERWAGQVLTTYIALLD
jgi:hypothetical protein